jgi:2-hydroxycyclohexanecarboxyl-CoA dehydrogenase
VDVKTAVVTGGASGIGRAVAQRLAADGYSVATLDINPSDSDFGHVADVSDRAQVDAALAAVRDRLGPVTILVNSAGVEGYKRFTNLTFEAWMRVIDVNLNGVFHCTQAVLPDMIEAGWGRIVNISSSSTHSGQPYMTHYVAAKSAVNGLTKALALEFGPYGITVNAVPPGFMAEMQAFYDAAFPLLEPATVYLGQFPVDDLPEPERDLLLLMMSLVLVSFPVEV